MGPLVALALSTPLWGFGLTPPTMPSLAPSRIASVHDVAVEAYVGPALRISADEAARTRTMMDLTRGFQLGATIGMAATVVLGAIQFGDEYGFHEDYADTACAIGVAVMDYCGGSTPVPHLIAAGTTAALGATALLLSTQVDYDIAAVIDGDWRTYEVTRWLGLGLNVLQAAMGFFLANSIRFGWASEQNDFDVLQGFATAHLILGVANLGVEAYNTAILF